jgi:hypothetical protein
MKQLILITAMLVAMTTKLLAQDKNAIEIKKAHNQSSVTQQETHQFEIVAKEAVDVNLKISLKTEDNLNVVVTDKKDNIILTKQFKKEGDNRLVFTMEENEKYTVVLNGNIQSNLVVSVAEN